LNRTKHSKDEIDSELCSGCGLCCNGVIFANVGLRSDDEEDRLRALGMPVRTPASKLLPAHLNQPCAAFDGCRCRIYPDRPQYCHEFECALLKSVKSGRTQPEAALRIIRTARERAEKVRCLVGALGDKDEQLPLSTRFRQTGKRLEQHELGDKQAKLYAELTLAVHDLNLMLADEFYPGRSRHMSKSNRLGSLASLLSAGLGLFLSAASLEADQVEMQNGDRYVGYVLSLNSNTVVLQSEVLGTQRLPRSKVAIITLGPSSVANSPAPPSSTNFLGHPLTATPGRATTNASPALAGMSISTNLIQQVQKQFLSGAGPEATDKFNELLGGFMSGKISVEDIRAQAKSAADQLRALKREGGNEMGLMTDAYLAILDHFLKDTAPSGSTTNAPAPAPKPKPEAEQE
jgi:uncharacterized protein